MTSCIAHNMINCVGISREAIVAVLELILEHMVSLWTIIIQLSQ